MTRAKRLQSIADLEAYSEQACARDLAAVRKRHEQLNLQLLRMQGYRQEYRSRFDSQGMQAQGAAALRDFHAFLQNLNVAIGQLEAQLAASAQALSRARQAWLTRNARTRAVTGAVDNAHAAGLEIALKSEQRETDDMVNARHARLSGGG